MAIAGYLFWPRLVVSQVDYKMPGNPGPKIAAAQAAGIERRERLIDQTVWRKEMEAEEYGRVFEDFWDALNADTNKWAIVEGLRFEEVVLGVWKEKQRLGHGIETWAAGKKPEPPAVYSYGRWRENVLTWKKTGWGIVQCEFRHIAFDPSRRWLLCTNQGSSTVTVFAHDARTGELRGPVQTIASDSPMFVQFV